MSVPELTQKEVLSLLGVTYKTLRRFERLKYLRVVRINRKVVRYYQEDVDSILAKGVK